MEEGEKLTATFPLVPAEYLLYGGEIFHDLPPPCIPEIPRTEHDVAVGKQSAEKGNVELRVEKVSESDDMWGKLKHLSIPPTHLPMQIVNSYGMKTLWTSFGSTFSSLQSYPMLDADSQIYTIGSDVGWEKNEMKKLFTQYVLQVFITLEAARAGIDNISVGDDTEKVHMENAHKENAHMENAHMENAHMENAHMENAHMENAHMENAHMENAHDKEKAHKENAHDENMPVRIEKSMNFITSVRKLQVIHKNMIHLLGLMRTEQAYDTMHDRLKIQLKKRLSIIDQIKIALISTKQACNFIYK